MLPASTLGPLLQQALGPTQGPRRAYPSAGALYPLEFYLAARTCEGVPQAMYHFDPLRHVLANIAPLPTDALFMRLVFAETPTCNLLENAAVVLIMTAVFDRTQTKYGERGYRFALLEAGHAAQNVLLCATAAGLDAVPLGGFCEDALGEALGLDARQESPLHVLLLGAR
jgi:SagB-type dehydrogenase family enzyme